MGRYMFYLVNHTQKAFCSFDSRIQLLEELKRIMDKNPSWTDSDNIKIQAQDEGKGCDMWDHLVHNLAYMDVDYHEHITA